MAQRKPDETVALICELPDHELDLMRKELSAEVYQLRALEDEKKRLVSAMGDQVEGAKERVKKLNNETETGKGVRSVICKWSIERDSNKREWVLRRTDTREAVRVEPLSAVDAQEEMFS